MATTEASIVGVATVILIILPGLFLNGMFLFMYGRRKRLQIPPIYFLISLTVMNLICICFWIGTTMVAQFGYTLHLSGPVPFNGYCQFQAILLVMYQSLHMHTYCIMALERVLKFYKPTLHAEVFYNDIVVILALVFMWILELVPGMFHIMTWGSVIYQTEQYQCTYDDTQATSRLNATFMYIYILPIVFIFICFLCVVIKYFLLKNNVGVSPGFEDTDVVEEDLAGGGGRTKVRGGKSGANPFNQDDDSDEEDSYNKLFAVYSEDDKDSERARQRVYKYRGREMDFALMIFFIFLVFLVLWLLYIVVVYMKAYIPLIATIPSLMPTGLETAATFLSHATLSVCPCLYWIVNRRFQRHIRIACNCGGNEPKEPKVYPRPEPVYRRSPGGPQIKNIHRGSLGEFNSSY